jgi:hypothetical protein
MPTLSRLRVLAVKALWSGLLYPVPVACWLLYLATWPALWPSGAALLWSCFVAPACLAMPALGMRRLWPRLDYYSWLFWAGCAAAALLPPMLFFSVVQLLADARV